MSTSDPSCGPRPPVPCQNADSAADSKVECGVGHSGPFFDGAVPMAALPARSSAPATAATTATPSAAGHAGSIPGRFASAIIVGRWLAFMAVATSMAALMPPWAAFGFMLLAGGPLQRRASSGMIHEAIHRTFSKKKRLNDRLGQYAASACLLDFEEAKREHLKHHAKLATAEDPEVLDMQAYGLRPTGMTKAQIVRMLLAPFGPRMILRNAFAVARTIGGSPCHLVGWTLVIAAALGAALYDPRFWVAPAALAGWIAASFTTRKFCWLLANATEHDFPWAHEWATGSTPRGRALAQLPTDLRWLALSRERTGWWTLITCPELEAENHGDHHAAAALPGPALPDHTATKLAHDARYRALRVVTAGLFRGKNGRDAAFGALLRGTQPTDFGDAPLAGAQRGG